LADIASFRGLALGLTSTGLARACSDLGVHAPEIWTILAVETSGCGFLADRRPQMLYERHIFHRLTEGRYDDGDISDPKPGGYGPRGPQQYDRLAEAILKDRSSALQSASWGIGQIMGANYRLAGFDDVEQMATSMSESEDKQLAAMSAFLIGSNLHVSLRAHDWTSFASGYNGPNYVINRYDVRLSGEFQKYSVGALPDLDVRAAQLYLSYLGFHPGPIDGIAGVQTLAAYADFESQGSIRITGTFGPECTASLRAALPPLVLR
jgi:N-acetylmuramidase/Putative peptidoglycan binding domain